MGDPLRDQELFEKIRALPEEKVAEVEDFVDLLRHREEDGHLRDQDSVAAADAQGFHRLAGVVSGPEDLSSRTAKRAWRLVESGIASWKGGKPRGSHPRPRIKGKSLSDMVLEDRR